MKFPLRRRSAEAPSTTATPQRATPEPEVFTGTTILPDEGAKERINSAADLDPNVRSHGQLGMPGGAGGYGGAGTK